MGECSRPIHTSCECIPHAKAECAATLPNPTKVGADEAPTDKEAGQAFERAAEIQTGKLNEPDDAANTLTEAFKVYRKTDPLDAARCLDVAINHYTAKGNFRRAATHKQNLAECYEVEIGDQKKAIESYELAASWFESDNAEAYVHSKVNGWYI